ncbi:LytR/AlgR family response regulator transcription factor [Sphingomonas sp. PR090111-T3T-6A]|uniref:LytR/AlgR family response regulator transcription factor n=1 Tax=Sphingomonas sp. PR090111-T3T-6A TaxID=685778 RepID=UPI0003723956|nr:LytTR family DNA-binding domain-containing protein [Sphingomonas sp. PR090111-T3T-6A]
MIGGGLILIGYSATLSVAHNLWLPEAIPAGFANTLPTLLFGAAAYWIIVRFVAGQSTTVQAVAHLLVGTAFAVLTYWLLLVMLGVLDGVSATQFEVRPFASRAMAWQLLQNVTTYGVVALFAYRPRQRGEAAPVAEGSPPRNPLSRYFIRSGDEILPVDVDAIVSITGADDYAEVATATGRHLARMTLAKFEQTLDPARFARVHRSRIVNLQRVTLAEPAGDGRLLLHLSNGERIVTSRAGAAALRERVL